MNRPLLALPALGLLLSLSCDDTTFPVHGGGGPPPDDYTPDWAGFVALAEDNCVSCHNPEGVARDWPMPSTIEADVLTGEGRYVVPGDPAASKLWRALSGEADPEAFDPPQMPLGAPLPREWIEHVRVWIESGARIGDPPVDADEDGYPVEDDCDDADAAVHPGADETCDGRDEDCDEEIDEDAIDPSDWYADADADGFGDPSATASGCDAPEGHVADDTDCDDANAAIHPEADEVCGGPDEDCDGAKDVGAIDAPTWYADADADGYGDDAKPAVACDAPTGHVKDGGDCDDADPRFKPGAVEACDDPTDFNCDGKTGFVDGDGDGFPACQDCADGDPKINPDATEVCDAADNDCDGTVDEADASDAKRWFADTDGDGHGDPNSEQAACTRPTGFVAVDDDCDDADPTAFTGATEVCDGADDDCDGVIDDGVLLSFFRDADKDTHGTPSDEKEACSAPSGYVSSSDDCDDTDASVFTGATETCDGVDEDCDGTVDDEASDATTFFEDKDGDGFGNPSSSKKACAKPSGFVTDQTDCDDAKATVKPGATETKNDVDDDCDGHVDEDFYTYVHSRDIQPLWDGYGCSGCHGFASDDAWPKIVNKKSSSTLDYIEPGDTSKSYIWHKINGTQAGVSGGGGDRMPKTGPPYMSAGDIAIVQKWILDGAPR